MEGSLAIVVEAVGIEVEGFERWKMDFMAERTLHSSKFGEKLRIIAASLYSSSFYMG